jgi:hypothetical protein
MSTHPPAVSQGGHWLITYSDMVTLLMALFICIIAYARKGGEECAAGGSVVWRPRLLQSRLTESKPERASVYHDPSVETSARIVQDLESARPDPQGDTFAIRLPLNVLFDEGERLSPSGMRILHVLADHLRELPYDLQFQVSRDERLPQAIKVCSFLAAQESYEPARLAAGSRPPQTDASDALWLVLFRQF